MKLRTYLEMVFHLSRFERIWFPSYDELKVHNDLQSFYESTSSTLDDYFKFIDHVYSSPDTSDSV